MVDNATFTSHVPHHNILVVDDSMINREILADMLSAKYKVETAENGQEALAILEERSDEFGAVLLDLNMPDIDGFEVLEKMNEWDLLSALPVIVISAEDSNEVENRTLALHATDFIRKPFDQNVVLRRVENVYELYSYRRSLEQRVEEQTQALVRSNEILRSQAKQIREFNENTIDLLGMVVEYRHSESGQHVQRVKAYTEILCQSLKENYPEYGLDARSIDRIAQASVLHDLGKIAIPDSILLKPGRLTQEEYNTMKNHTIYGDNLLGQIKGAWDDDFAQIARQICRHHHERYDGNGYPDGLVGEDIPIAAQVVSLADVFDALVSDRVYKDAYTPEVAFRMIQNNECGVFSPKLLKCLNKVQDEFLAVLSSNSKYQLGGGLAQSL